MLWKVLTRNVFLIAFCGVEWQAIFSNSCGYAWGILKEHCFASLRNSEVIVVSCPSLATFVKHGGKGWFEKNRCKSASWETTRRLCGVREELPLPIVSWWLCVDVRFVHLMSWRWWHQPSWEAVLQFFPARALDCYSKSRFLWAGVKSVVVDKLRQH